MRFKILYIIAVFCWLVYPVQFFFGLPVTPRQIMAVVLFFACVVEEKKPYWSDRYFNIYLIYILFYFISCAAEGYLVEGFRRIVGDFFIAYVAYWSTKIICVKYQSPKFLIYTLLVIGVFDSVITICQVLHISIFDNFLATFQLIGYERFLEYGDRELMGMAIPGIMSSPVTNGHILLLSSILSLYLCRNKFNLIGTSIFIINIIGLFFAQMRTAFSLAVVLSVFIVYKIIVSKQTVFKVVLVIVFLLGIIYGGSYLFNLITVGESRYANLGLDDNGRNYIYTTAFQYLVDNPIFGSYNTFVNTYHIFPHNFFLNAYLHAGIIGFIAVVILAFKQLIYSFKVCLGKSKNKQAIPQLIFASIIIGFFGDGITHNISLANGDVMVWLIWCLLVFYYDAENSKDETRLISINEKHE